MKEKRNLYVAIAYSAMEVPDFVGVMTEQWADIGGHKCLGTFLLEKVEEKKMLKKPVDKGFVEYRTKQPVHGTHNVFHRPDDLPLASECNEEFLTWFIAPLEAADTMLSMEEYMAAPIDSIKRSLTIVEQVYQAGAKKDQNINLPNQTKVI